MTNRREKGAFIFTHFSLLAECAAFSALLTLSAVTTPAANASSEPVSAWQLVEEQHRLEFTHGRVRYVAEANEQRRAAWLAIRDDAGWDRSSAAYNGRPLDVAIPALLAMKRAGVLDWERALIAAHARLGTISTDSAARWLSLFDAAPSLSDRAFVQRIYQLRQYDRGSAMAVFSPRCVPDELAVLSAAERLLDVETSIPARRSLDTSGTIELPTASIRTLEDSGQSVFAQAVAHALNGASMSGRIWAFDGIDAERQSASNVEDPDDSDPARGPSIVAVPAFLSAFAPARPVDEPAPETADETACDASDVALVAEMAWIPRSRWATLEPEIRRLAASGFIPAKSYWRAAVHQYLQANGEALRTLASLYSEQFPDSAAGPTFLAALADLVDGTVDDEPSTWPQRRDATNPTWLWIYAEHLRAQRRFEDAAETAARVIDQDARFLGGWLTDAAVALRRGDLETVSVSLARLEEAAPERSIYAYWATSLRIELEEMPSTDEALP